MQSLTMMNDDTVVMFECSSEDTWYALLEKFFQGAQALSYVLPYSPGELVEMLEESIDERRESDKAVKDRAEKALAEKEDRYD